VQIGEDAGRAALLVDGVVQSISLEDGLANGGYWAAMLPSLPPRRALILGLGGGTLARLLAARFGKSVRMVGVDDDVAIIETARAAGWLAVPNLELVVGEAF
jgi:spermidine synthase